jgi:predicted SprT family Zn-dependent metalloprotease
MSRDTESQWVWELHKEVKQIMSETGLKLPRPAIKLHESEEVWGRWDPLNLSISLSRAVLQTCSWRVVVEILKHELAHQITDDQYGHEVSPHGPEFGQVCTRLRIEEWARSAASGKSLSELQCLSDWRRELQDEATIRYRRRLEKLLALADSANEHEALLAMRRAQELQEQQRLVVRPKEECSPPMVSLEIGAGKQRHAAFEGRIASILMSHFHVDVVFATRFDTQSCRPEAIIDLLGRREDVLLAEYVHGFLHQSALRLWQDKRRASKSRGLRAKNSYIRGLLSGFDDKLTKENLPPQDAGTGAAGAPSALIQADEKQRAQYVKSRYPRLSARRSTARIDRGAYRAGQNEGGKLNLRPPVTSGGGRKTARLLPS